MIPIHDPFDEPERTIVDPDKEFAATELEPPVAALF